jgi:hypothetical protein
VERLPHLELLHLLLLLLKQVVSTKSHHVSRHHVRKDVGEREGLHLLVSSTGSAELLEAGKLSLRLSEAAVSATECTHPARLSIYNGASGE